MSPLPTELAAVQMTVRELPDLLRPCHVVRDLDAGLTLVVYDPRSTRVEVTAWMLDNLWPSEQQFVRDAMLLPPLGERMPDWTTEECGVLLYVPAALRVPGEMPVQGGRELMRRRRLGQLALERAMYGAELRSRLVRPRR